MDYNIDYFIGKFSAIPEHLWLVDMLIGDDGAACAIGHCYNGNYTGQVSKEFAGLKKVFANLSVTQTNKRPSRYANVEPDGGWHIACINNGDAQEYQQISPKQRILAALADIKKMEKPKVIVEKKRVYVAVPETITEEMEVSLS